MIYLLCNPLKVQFNHYFRKILFCNLTGQLIFETHYSFSTTEQQFKTRKKYFEKTFK